MRHITLIITAVVITFIAVFVVRHLMWMKGLEKEFDVERLSDSSVRKTERAEKHNQDHQGGMEGPVQIREKETISVQDRQAPAGRPETAGQERKQPDYETSERGAQSLQENSKVIYEKGSGEMIDYSGRGIKDQGKENNKTASGPRKTASITLKNKTMSITLKDSSPLPPAEEAVKEVMSTMQHPTSTVPH